MLGPGGFPPNLAQAPKFLIGSIVTSLSGYCLPNDEGPSPQIFFPRTATGTLAKCHQPAGLHLSYFDWRSFIGQCGISVLELESSEYEYIMIIRQQSHITTE